MELRKQKASKAKANNRSRKIMGKLRYRKLGEIFDVLDSDGDGKISAQKIEIQRIETEVLEYLAPLLCEMEEEDCELTKEMFLMAGSKLLDVRLISLIFYTIPHLSP